MHIMPKINDFLDLSSLFVALMGVLFAVFQPVFDKHLTATRPDLYRNRKAYISGLARCLISRALPLSVFCLSYVFSLSGVIISVAKASFFTFNPLRIDPIATLFVLNYLLSIFIFILCMHATLCLATAWWNSDAGRQGEPRITWFR